MKTMVATTKNINEITDITDQYNYEDTNSDNKSGDRKWVSCGQDDSYNELEFIYNSHLEPHVISKSITKQDALDALNECCKELENPRSRDDFYKCLEKKLDIKIEV